MLTAVWHYRSFVRGMVRREFQARYLNSVLGSAWALIAPLSTILIYTVIFGRIMHARLAGVDDNLGYGIFLCAGVTTWGMFTEVIQRSISIFIEHANLLKKMSFPRATLPLIVLLSAAVNFAIVFGLLLLFLAATGRFPGTRITHNFSARSIATHRLRERLHPGSTVSASSPSSRWAQLAGSAPRRLGA